MKTKVSEKEARSPAAQASGTSDEATKTIKILIVDDHALFRQGFAMILSDIYPNARIFEAASSAAALKSAKENPDIALVLLDLTLEDGSGFETLEKLNSILPDAVVAIVSVSEDSKDISRAYRAGARGYIVKSSGSDVLRHALPLILAGETYVPSHAVSLLTGGVSPRCRTPRPRPRPREAPTGPRCRD